MTDNPPAPPAPTPPAPAAVTFTPEQQAEIDRIMGRTREEGRRSGAADARSEIEAYLAAEAETQRIASLQGEEQLRAQVAAAEAARVAAEAEAARLAAETAARSALLAADFNPATIDDALRLLGDGDLAETVPALAGRLPALLNDTEGTPSRPGTPAPKRQPNPGSPGGGGSKTAADRAKERFASTQTPLAKSA